MRKKLIITAVLASVMVMCFAQKPHKIMFYNMENFFDTIDDPETNDEEFLPDRCEAVEYGQVRQETPQHGARVVRHRPPSTATIRR